MASHKSPLRDRLLSNSPDPIKSSILRESGMGWNASLATNPTHSSGSAGSITSPLRIAKRDSPGRVKGPAVARRTSSSYRHVHTNNLVSKSPFKSQIPTPATPSSRPPPISFPTRRVSGEKRPRPSSMHELGETENDRPFALKRDRKQSKTFQGLIEREPVTKSPFRTQQQPAVAKPNPPPIPINYETTPASSTPPAPSHISVPTGVSSGGPSPGRSALVSRRMHGPRLSGGAKRERRKTVTFHERCDVLEFDREDDTEEEVFESADEEANTDNSRELMTEGSPPGAPSSALNNDNDRNDTMEEDISYESIQLSDSGFNPPVPSLLSDPDASITGIVEEMFSASNAANLLAEVSMSSSLGTPPRHSDIPTDLDTEDGVPFGRSHHVDRFFQSQQHSTQHQPPHFSPYSSPTQHVSPTNRSPSAFLNSFNLPTHASPLGPPATPPRRSPGAHHSTPPLGRTTHLERIRKARDEEKEDEATADDVERLPMSPSPMKRPCKGETSHEDGLIPRFDLEIGNPIDIDANRSTNINVDPFEPRIQDESILSELQRKDDSIDRSISIGNSEVNLSALLSERDCNEVLHSLETSFEGEGKSSSEEPRSKPSSPSEPPSTILRRMTPPAHSGSPLLAAVQGTQTLGKIASRERISREEVQRRLMNQRSPSSPIPEKLGRYTTQSPSIFVDPGETNVLETQQPETQQLLSSFDKEINRLSVLTTQTDFSTETAIVETAEKRSLGMTMLGGSSTSNDNEFGLLDPSQRLQFDFGSKFSLGGLGISSEDTDTRMSLDSRSDHGAHAPRGPLLDENKHINTSGMKMGDVDVDMDMKSALDRLMEDVAGAGARADDSMTDEFDDSFEQSQSHDDNHDFSTSRPKVIARAATDSVLLQHNEADGVISRTVSGSSTMTAPPPVPPKDNIMQREQIILEKRREARRIEEEEDGGFQSTRGKDQQHLGVGRPSRRRSMSTGDAEVLSGGAKKRGNALLDIVATSGTGDDLLADSIEKELQKLVQAPTKTKYHVREREATIYASSSDEKVSHMAGPGDVDAGRAWRTVRRPSDMNEYAKQIREYRAQEKGKAYGKVFVKVMGIKGMHLPLPREPTAFTCTLNNGIHFVTTPECQLSTDCRIEQEFELIEHSKLEFTLTLKVRRDPHIISQYKAVTPGAPTPAPAPVQRAPPVVQSASKSSGMRSFFSSSPKKSSKEKIAAQPPPSQPQPKPVQRLAENLARHLKPDGTLARAFISFKDIASRCDTRLFETSYPLIGQRVEPGGKFSTLEVGEIILQLFRLPPLPGVPQDQLPQSLDECHRGLRHINWHKVTYFQGTLTQSGGDCSTWRRRQLRVIGSNLVAFNDVTKKATATIDLKKAIAVEDDQEARSSQSPDEYDGLYGVERSFRLIFPQSQEILFFADSDEEKSKWLEVLRALVGRIPPHPLWAELLWQRQEEISKRMAAAQQTVPQPTSPTDTSRRPQY